MIIATRNACLTADVNHFLFGDKHEYLSQAHVRVDVILDIKKYKTFRSPTEKEIDNHIFNKDTVGVYRQAVELAHFINKVPEYFIIDNYSELTNKRFEHKNGYVFSGMYTDINKEDFIPEKLTDYKLLNKNIIQDKYDEYFDFMRNGWPNTKFIFTHFPIEQDTREKYINQWNVITNAIDNLSGKYNIQNIHADKDQIEFVGDGERYHFTKRTAKNMASKIKL